MNMTDKISKPYVIVVSGLPRSGTSMMMRAIHAGGVEALTDHLRTADEDNPRGYFEFEPVKKTKVDSSWLNDAAGKVVKMVYRLLYDLPNEFMYRVVFMQRDLKEVLASQKKMLKRSGKDGCAIGDEQMAELFQAELDRCAKWLREQSNFSVLFVNHRDMLKTPAEECRRVSEFLGGVLDVEAMASTVDPSLYRNRAK